MALLFVDSFDHYVTADITKKWSSVDGAATISAGNGRRGGGALLISSLHGPAKSITTVSTAIAGVACYHYTAVDSGLIVSFKEGGTYHANVKLNTNNTVSVCRGSTVLATSNVATQLLLQNTWNYIEFKATIHDTTGSYELRVNGVTWLSGTNVDTRNSATGVINSVKLGGDSGEPTADAYYDDFYICDTTGSAPQNDFLGDVRVDCVLPNANGNYSTWTPSTGTDHFAVVDESTPNTTDYISDGTAGNKDSVGLAALPSLSSQTIFGVQVLAGAWKDDAGARSLKVGIRSGSTDNLGSANALSTSQVYYSNIYQTDPNTSTAWTEANINAAEALVEVV